MAANCSGRTCKCYEAGIYDPEEAPPPSSLLIAAAVHLYAVVILGTLCNGVAIWCIVTCKKTRPAVKVLLYSVFVPLLLICLVTQPLQAEIVFAVLNCDPERTPKAYRMISALLYSFLAQMELAFIATLAIVRTVAVWSPHRHEMKLRVALVIVASVSVYSFFSTVGILGSLWMGYVEAERVGRALVIIYFFMSTMLPFLVTAIAYALMIFAVRQNRLHHALRVSKTGNSTLLDQATRAMLAVFISNLVFGFPHAIYHLLDKPSHSLELSFHMLFYTHFVVDPVVFVWYNSNYKWQVWQAAKAGWNTVLDCYKLPSPCNFLRKSSSVLPLWKSSPSSDQESSSSSVPKGSHLSLRPDVVLKESEAV